MTDLFDLPSLASDADGKPAAEAVAPAAAIDPVTDQQGTPVGVVDGSASTTTQSFQIVLNDQAVVQLDDLLCVTRSLPDGNTVTHYGIVVEIRGSIEEATYSSDTVHIAVSRTLPGTTCRTAEVRILRNDPEVWVPPDPGTGTRSLSDPEREKALFRDQMTEALPLGLDRSNRPVWVDWSFMNGEKGGHMSISGISGVATKTSYALFALYMLLETPAGHALLGMSAPNTRALVFNVKSEDLLYIDRPNLKFAVNAEAQAKWAALGVPQPGPFRQVHLHAPRRPSRGGAADPDTARTDGKVAAFGWTPFDFIREGLLDYCFTDTDERRGGSQVSFVIQRVRSMLQRLAYPSASIPGGAAVIVDRLPDHAPRDPSARAPIGRDHGSEITSFDDLVDFLDTVLDPDHGNAAWHAGVQANTATAFLRRLYAAQPRLGHLIACGVTPVDTTRGGVTVVDIHSLHDTAQRFVVGALLHRIFDAKQGQGRLPLQFVVLDELNRYGPKDGSSPIKDILVDIAARGRSMGVLLIGAQQSAGDIDGNITRNASVKVVGRLDAADTADYGFLSAELRQRATRILPGAMVLNQPVIPESLLVHYPFPPYATCQDEADMRPDPDQRARIDSIIAGI
jgi:DNA helicase HerA-like ATPase